MVKKLLVGLALAISAAAQAVPPLPDNNFIYVIGEGTVSVPPDRARITVTVRASGPDHQKAFAQLQMDAKAVVAEARGLGVSDKDVDAHRIGKSYRERGANGPSLPELEQTIEFELRDLDKAVALADLVLKLQSVHEVSSSFFVADPGVRAAQARATTEAAADAQRRAQELARLFGRKAGKATSLATEDQGTMRERFGATQGGFRAYEVNAISAGANNRVPNAIEFSSRVFVIYALE